MEVTKGYVTYAGNNLFKGKKLFSFRISTEDKFFGTGTVDHKLQKNDYVEFEYSHDNGRYTVDVSSIRHIANQESSPAGNPNQGTKGTGNNSSGGASSYWDTKAARDVENDAYRKANDLRIQYQSARNAAITVVDVLLREKLLPLAKSDKADNVSVVLGKIHDLTDEFMDKCTSYNSGLGTDVPSGAAVDGVAGDAEEWN